MRYLINILFLLLFCLTLNANININLDNKKLRHYYLTFKNNDKNLSIPNFVKELEEVEALNFNTIDNNSRLYYSAAYIYMNIENNYELSLIKNSIFIESDLSLDILQNNLIKINKFLKKKGTKREENINNWYTYLQDIYIDKEPSIFILIDREIKDKDPFTYNKENIFKIDFFYDSEIDYFSNIVLKNKVLSNFIDQEIRDYKSLEIELIIKYIIYLCFVLIIILIIIYIIKINKKIKVSNFFLYTYLYLTLILLMLILLCFGLTYILYLYKYTLIREALGIIGLCSIFLPLIIFILKQNFINTILKNYFYNNSIYISFHKNLIPYYKVSEINDNYIIFHIVKNNKIVINSNYNIDIIEFNKKDKYFILNKEMSKEDTLKIIDIKN